MSAFVRTEIASGVSLLLADGWEFEAVGESSKCFEIMINKGGAQACLRLIALGKYSMESGFDQFHFSILESLVAFGCTVEPVDTKLKGVIAAIHPEKIGKINHYLRKTTPLIHMSAAGITSDELTKELVLMADSINLEESKFLQRQELEFGELEPFLLNGDLWKS